MVDFAAQKRSGSCQHPFRSTVYTPRTQPPDQPPPITVKPAFVVAQVPLVPRLCNVPLAYTNPWLLICCWLLLRMHAVCTTTGTSRSPCA